MAPSGMATLFRKKRNGKELPHWYCGFQIPDGNGGTRQVQRTTGKTHKRDAVEVAIKLEADARKEAGTDDDTASAIFSRVREAGELAVKGLLTASQGRDFISEIMELSGHQRPKAFTMNEWADKWIEGKNGTVKPATLAFYRGLTKSFISFLGDRADAPLEAITTEDIVSYRNSLREKGRTAKTANHHLIGVRSLFGEALKTNPPALTANPALPIKTLDENDSVSRQAFTPGEVRRLTENAPSNDWRGIIILGAFTGLRLGDLAKLKSGDIDLEKGTISVIPQKTNRKKKNGTANRVEIPLHHEAITFLTDGRLSPFPKTPAFPSLHDQPAGRRDGLSFQFRAIMEAAGIDRGLVRTRAEGAARDTAAKSFHSLRHTFTTWLANANVPEEVRMEMTGHTETDTHRKYTHREMEVFKEAVNSLPSLNQG